MLTLSVNRPLSSLIVCQLLSYVDMPRLLSALHEAEMMLQSTESGTCKVSCKFFLKKLKDMGPFCGATDTLVLDFWRRVPWVSKSGWIPLLYASSLAYNGFLRFRAGKKIVV